MNDVNYSAGSSSLRLYADDTTQYIAHESPCTLESTLNQDIERLTLWFPANYLQVNASKTQAMTLEKSQYPYNIFIGDKSIEIEPTLKILGVTLDRDLSFKPHVVIMPKKAYAKIAALRRIKRLVPSELLLLLLFIHDCPHVGSTTNCHQILERFSTISCSPE